MVERILGITPVQRINHYDDQRSSKDSLKRRPQMGFQRILEQKLSSDTKTPAPYSVSISKRQG